MFQNDVLQQALFTVSLAVRLSLSSQLLPKQPLIEYRRDYGLNSEQASKTLLRLMESVENKSEFWPSTFRDVAG
jgi:hypothetical protein